MFTWKAILEHLSSSLLNDLNVGHYSFKFGLCLLMVLQHFKIILQYNSSIKVRIIRSQFAICESKCRLCESFYEGNVKIMTSIICFTYFYNGCCNKPLSKDQWQVAYSAPRQLQRGFLLYNQQFFLLYTFFRLYISNSNPDVFIESILFSKS